MLIKKEYIIYQIEHERGNTFTTSEYTPGVFWIGRCVAKFRVKPKKGVRLKCDKLMVYIDKKGNLLNTLLKKRSATSRSVDSAAGNASSIV